MTTMMSEKKKKKKKKVKVTEERVGGLAVVGGNNDYWDVVFGADLVGVQRIKWHKSTSETLSSCGGKKGGVRRKKRTKVSGKGNLR